MDNVEIELWPIKWLSCLSVRRERLFDFFCLAEVKQTYASALLAGLRRGFIMLEDLRRKHTECEVWLALD